MNRPHMVHPWLSGTWWLLFPAFACLTVALTFERACADPYDLLPVLASRPHWAWPIAALYVLSHLWAAAAYVVTTSEAQTLLPHPGVVRSVWGRNVTKPALMLAALMLEYLPVPLLRFVGARLCS